MEQTSVLEKHVQTFILASLIGLVGWVLATAQETSVVVSATSVQVSDLKQEVQDLKRDLKAAYTLADAERDHLVLQRQIDQIVARLDREQ